MVIIVRVGMDMKDIVWITLIERDYSGFPWFCQGVFLRLFCLANNGMDLGHYV